VDDDDQGAYGHRMGLRAGDVVVAVNGTPVLGQPFDTFRKTLSGVISKGPGTPVVIEVHRAGEPALFAGGSNSSSSAANAGGGAKAGLPPPPPPRAGAAAVAAAPSAGGATATTFGPSSVPGLPSHDATVTCPPNPACGALGVVFAGGEAGGGDSGGGAAGNCSPIVVDALASGSYGGTCGLQPGDEVVAVGAKVVEGATLQSFQGEVLRLLQSKQPVVFALRRAPQQPDDDDEEEGGGGKLGTGKVRTPQDEDVGADDDDQSHKEGEGPGWGSASPRDGDGDGDFDDGDDGDDGKVKAKGEAFPSPPRADSRAGSGAREDDPDLSAAEQELTESEVDDTHAKATGMMDMDTQQWLQSLNLGQFIPAFSDLDICDIAVSE
jgi:hypothetical protein